MTIKSQRVILDWILDQERKIAIGNIIGTNDKVEQGLWIEQSLCSNVKFPDFDQCTVVV